MKIVNVSVYNKIKQLADDYTKELKSRISNRIEEMQSDDTSHFLIYRVLGIPFSEGKLIDEYQSKGRFLYKYAGSFLENATLVCLKHKFPDSAKMRIPNTKGSRPSTFEIDCLVNNFAHEIKWRDATTDGDHITKEHTRVSAIKEAGYIPVRVMFYYPQRKQAIKIQETLKTLYQGIGGFYYSGNDAWNYINKFAGIDLLAILNKIANSREGGLW